MLIISIRLSYQQIENDMQIISKMINNEYKIVKILFTMSNHLYTLVENKDSLQIYTGIITQAIEKEEEHFKVNSNRLNKKYNNYVIVPEKLVKGILNGKKIYLYITKDRIYPLLIFLKERNYQIKNMEITAMLKDLINAIYLLHSNKILHGRINPNTVFIKTINKNKYKYSLNLLDTINYSYKQTQTDKFFRSEGYLLDLQLNEKDDFQSLIYFIAHMCSKCKLFTTQNMKNHTITDPLLQKWKPSNFYRELINLLPKSIFFIQEIYLYLKCIDRKKQKPNYIYWINQLNQLRDNIKLSTLNEYRHSLQENDIMANYDILEEDEKTLSEEFDKLKQKQFEYKFIDKILNNIKEKRQNIDNIDNIDNKEV